MHASQQQQQQQQPSCDALESRLRAAQQVWADYCTLLEVLVAVGEREAGGLGQ
jgi:hypothetical protein